MSYTLVAPKTVAELAPHVNIGGERAQRLLTDPRMVDPWRAIEDRAKQCERSDNEEFRRRVGQLPHSLQAKPWLDVPRSNWELAVCAIFLAVATEAALQNPAVYKKDIEHEARRWRVGADLCKEACNLPHRAGVHPELGYVLDPELNRALHMAAAYFDYFAASVENGKAGPLVVKRATRERGRPSDPDDDLRVRARTVSRVVRSLLGDPLNKAVTMLSNVVFGCEINTKDVANWSKEP
jgi:hypothetical protein